MATTSKAMFRGAFATSNATLYPVPAGTTAVVTDIWVTNTAATPGTFTIKLDEVEIAAGMEIAANGVVNLTPKQVLAGTKLIEGSASANTIKIHISGVEIV
jgi:hypothetical protein